MTANAASRSTLPLDWRDLALLGEQIVGAPSLAAQRDHILATASRLLAGEVELWLHEGLFHLPGANGETLFPTEPGSPAQRDPSFGRTNST